MKVKTGYSNLLYYPHPTADGEKYQDCIGYWTSSPNGAYGNYRMHTINSSGAINSEDWTINGYSVRPVVALRSNIGLSVGTSGYDYNLIVIE